MHTSSKFGGDGEYWALNNVPMPKSKKDAAIINTSRASAEEKDGRSVRQA